MRESEFQAKLIKRIRKEIDGSIVLKNDANYIQGIPDLIVIHGATCACLECKRKRGASRRPNQSYYISKIKKDGGFAEFISPENEDAVVKSMTKYFSKRRNGE